MAFVPTNRKREKRRPSERSCVPMELEAVMAGYPVQRGRPPAITREAARRQARDSGTLSGTSAEEEQMTGKIMPLRERDTSTIQAAADAFAPARCRAASRS